MCAYNLLCNFSGVLAACLNVSVGLVKFNWGILFALHIPTWGLLEALACFPLCLYQQSEIVVLTALITHWRRGHLNCLNARSRDFNNINTLNAELHPICYLLALLAHHFLHVSRIRVKSLTLRLLMSYICGAPILDVSRSHTTTQHSR